MTEILKCLIADDEDLAVKLLQAYVQQTEGIEIATAVTSAKEVTALIEQNNIDIIFLDIQMPTINGLQLAEKLSNPPMIVFTTAYANYAVEGFRLNAVDYLLKPFSYERFLQAIDKCREYYHFKKLKKENQNLDCIYIRTDGIMVKVLLSDILFIEGWKQYIKIYTPEKSILTLESMKNMEENLPDSKFVRVHKSYIVSAEKADVFAIDELQINGHKVPIGKTYREAVKKHFSSL
jgi:DNA-binding LytR/AlgR family response regulator